MNPGWIRLHRMPMRSEDDYELLIQERNLLIVNVVKTTASGALNRLRSCFIVRATYADDFSHTTTEGRE